MNCFPMLSSFNSFSPIIVHLRVAWEYLEADKKSLGGNKSGQEMGTGETSGKAERTDGETTTKLI